MKSTSKSPETESKDVKSTGITRKVDGLGRVTIPAELRRTLNISEKDTLEIYVEGESIILRKYQPSCIFCSGVDDVMDFGGKLVCGKCVSSISAATAAR